MIRQNKGGFTIIEVVITIAIGAAVMALVLNAVAGARRAQRNNARTNDVNQIASGVNQYIATRNRLPTNFGEITNIVDPTKFGHYEISSINGAGSWIAGLPAPLVTAFCSIAGHTSQADCIQTGTWTTTCSIFPAIRTTAALCTNPGVWTPAGTVGGFDWDARYATAPTGTDMDPSTGNADHLVVINQASCSSTSQVAAGGIREVAIVYALEGQTDIVCLEI